MPQGVRANVSARYRRVFALASVILAAAGAFAVASESEAAEPADRAIVFVVDTSTSMYGVRLAEAKKALIGAASAIPAGAQVALRSFGGPCQDGGIARLPLGPYNPAAFNSAVESLSTGAPGTPTPAALRAAAATLPAAGYRTLVLISDGGSSCGDPCPTARQIADRLGAGFRFEVLGFGAAESAEEELDCVAEVTDSTYVHVTDSGGLQKAIARSTTARITALRLSPRIFTVAATGGSIGRVLRPKVGTQVLYAVSERLKVRFTVEKAAAGRKAKRKCQKPTAKNRRGGRCTRYVKMLGSFTHDGRQGANRFKFTGRLRGKRLRPGRYRLVASAINAPGNTPQQKRVSFRIVRR